ncbi:MAG: hypothetical protein GWN18_02665, partial [Thermoplasmata archaeon]|nr:right-handed parallel beta-helix repeat-containing protein [Thermoplasmata archaeon]NIS10922.1 right-handed parallel beta-helix repeat-containing protein [Thermoplasmata archaeon]NIS18845.1 right-handed parallel beta-helix repeat-containing protein [Thermoplasmata archaeon]NIT75875.1 right-handed parallel beta-helix repeat-containing protein [Thermoplasmata archaeon]NIU48002.1 right-handed parallel beta-helix repeat-containing protein [Thermoplasmata archaeon]
DCPLAIDGDPQGEVAYETDIVSDIMNSTCSLNGRLSVMASGELNITASTMAFLGDDATSSGVEARLGSVLRITEGSILEGRGGTFGVIANGTLVVRKSSFIRGGEPGGPAAMACNGGAAVLVNSTFRDCGLALSLGGSDPTVRGCVFTGNRQSVLLEAVLRLRIIGCSFSLSNTSWDIHGNFTSNLQITECTFEGGGSVPMAMFIQSPFGSNSVLTLRNVTIANYTVWGLQDDHYGNIQMTGCTITSASVRLGRWAGDAATVSDVNVSGCRFE